MASVVEAATIIPQLILAIETAEGFIGSYTADAINAVKPVMTILFKHAQTMHFGDLHDGHCKAMPVLSVLNPLHCVVRITQFIAHIPRPRPSRSPCVPRSDNTPSSRTTGVAIQRKTKQSLHHNIKTSGLCRANNAIYCAYSTAKTLTVSASLAVTNSRHHEQTSPFAAKTNTATSITQRRQP